LLVWVIYAFSQKDTSTLTQADYLKKSRSQKTAAKILLGGGTAMFLTGLFVITDDAVHAVGNIFNPNPPPDKNNTVLANVLCVVGGAAVIGSILLFISAGDNKRKAASISFKLEKMPVMQKQSQVNRSFPAVTLSIALTRNR
ncbi:MAG TPA: hypothetical protein VNA26_07420, partial [Chitinophagaceae bacterium]|nr:hypothetical protein [Chitinophagaceae bacterium]